MTGEILGKHETKKHLIKMTRLDGYVFINRFCYLVQFKLVPCVCIVTPY